MYLTFASREALLEHLPKNAVVAEIGVAEGEFSCRILAMAQPKELHLIDPWAFQNRSDYIADHNNVAQAEQNERFHAIQQKFFREIAQGKVVLHRGFSQEVAANFKPATFDWIYVDGMHTFEAVRDDLALYLSKMKKGGLILGHDYAEHLNSQQMSFGVVPAVDEFVRNSGWEFTLLTLEPYPTYLLSETKNPRADQIAREVVFKKGGIRFQNYPQQFEFSQFVMSNPDGECRVFPEFRVRSHEG